MERRRSHPLIALLCALCLLGAQQAANAHFVGHLEAAGQSAAFETRGDVGDVPAVDAICATCAAFAALSSAPPAQPPVLFAVARAADGRPAVPAAAFAPAPAAPPYASRAPPAVL